MEAGRIHEGSKMGRQWSSCCEGGPPAGHGRVAQLLSRVFRLQGSKSEELGFAIVLLLRGWSEQDKAGQGRAKQGRAVRQEADLEGTACEG
ncbi:MAG: hypothetical protein FRX49_00664 [Trebouxia sp. A1-2]|nr:MAG: hypothetical protein FRX49_00664 [Trebouxia sp. A1-2]